MNNYSLGTMARNLWILCLSPILNLRIIVYIFAISWISSAWTAPVVASAPHTNLCGDLTQDTTLTLEMSPYQVDCAVTVTNGVRLTIEAGVKLVMMANPAGVAMILNEGSELIVAGTEEEPVRFLSGAATPTAGDWAGFQFNSGARVTIDHCEIAHAGRFGLFPALRIGAANVTIRHCLIRDNLGDAIYLLGNDLLPHFEDLQINNNGGIAVNQLTPTMSPIYRRIAASGNATDAIVINGGILTNQYEWSFADAKTPIQIKSSVTVNPESTLAIEAGSILHFQQNASLRVGGRLIALGEPDQPITLTGAEPTPGSWSGLSVNPDANVILRNCELAYGGGLGIGVLQIYPSTTVVESCAIHHSAAEGILVQDGAQPILRHNQIVDNAFGLRNALGSPEIDARDNWWGDASGPFHPTRNPTGLGNAVSDGVTFTDALTQQPNPVPPTSEDMRLRVVGPRFSSPGETENYFIRYVYNGAVPITDGVLTLKLPRDAGYLQDNYGGTYWRERHELYWELGTIQPGDEAIIVVEVRYFWGLQDDQMNTLLARIGGSNWEAGELDVTPYLNHTPEAVYTSVPMSGAEINDALAGNATLKKLYDEIVADGYRLLGGSLLSATGSSSIRQLVMLRGHTDSLYIFSDGLTVLAFSYRPDYFELRDPTGGAGHRMSTGQTTYWGTWDVTSEQRIATVAVTFGQCMSNCTAEKFGLIWAASKFSQTVSSIVNGASCFSCIDSEDVGACQSCLGALSALPFVGEILDAKSCYNDCKNAHDSHICTDTMPILTCSPGNLFSSLFGSCAYVKYTCDPDTGISTAALISGGYGATCVTGEGCISCSMSPRRCEAPPVDDDGDLYGEDDYDYQSDDYGNDNDFQDNPLLDAAAYLRHLPTFPPRRSSTKRLATLSEPATSTAISLQRAAGSCGANCDPAYTLVTEAKDPNAKAGTLGFLLPGELITYTIDYENVGTGTAFGVFVVDQLGEEFVIESLQLPPDAIYFAASRQILWEIGEVAPVSELGSKGTVSFTVRVRDDLPSGTIVMNRAIVHFPSVPEETPTNPVINLIQPLIARPQQVATSVNEPVAIQLDGYDISGAPLTYAIVSQSVNGQLDGTPPNLLYTPGVDYVGRDLFMYNVSNGITTTEPTAVSIQIRPGANDGKAPAILWTYPEDGQILSAVDSSLVLTAGGNLRYYMPIIQAGFTEQLALRTVTADQVWLQDSQGKRLAVQVEYEANFQRIVLLPLNPLAPGLYTVQMTTALTDRSGNALVSPYHWEFQIGSADTSTLYLPYIER